MGFLQGLGERVANEKDLERIQHSIVEEPVLKIIDVLRSDNTTLRRFDLGGGVVFDNYSNGLRDGAEEPSQRRARTDTISFVVKYKSPHKPTMPHLRLGLRESVLPVGLHIQAT